MTEILRKKTQKTKPKKTLQNFGVKLKEEKYFPANGLSIFKEKSFSGAAM